MSSTSFAVCALLFCFSTSGLAAPPMPAPEPVRIVTQRSMNDRFRVEIVPSLAVSQLLAKRDKTPADKEHLKDLTEQEEKKVPPTFVSLLAVGDSEKRLWRVRYPARDFSAPDRAVVADSGKYVALFEAVSSAQSRAVVVLGPGGKLIGSFKLSDFLAKRELDHVPRMGAMWTWDKDFSGEFHKFDEREGVLVLRVAQGASNKPIYERLPTRIVKVSLSSGAVVK